LVHLLEHTQHTLQGLYIELEVPNLLLQILDVLKVHKPLSIPVIQLSLQLSAQPVSPESAAVVTSLNQNLVCLALELL
jgi:hypothetical protein